MALRQARPVRPRRPAARAVYRPGPPALIPTVMPYDYGATFQLVGEPGTVLEDVVNVGADGTFVAVGIGYGLEPQCERRLVLDQSDEDGPGFPVTLEGISLGHLNNVAPGALLSGIKLHQGFMNVPYRVETVARRNGHSSLNITRRPSMGGVSATSPNLLGTTSLVPSTTASVNQPSQPLVPANEAFRCLEHPGSLSFLFSMMDSSTGRELQDQPVLNLASMGEAEGRRPFRMLASPITLHPRSSLRMQVIERSRDVQGVLFVVLYGYRVLTPGCAEPLVRSLRSAPMGVGPGMARRSDRVIPFDYVASFDLTGIKGNTLLDEVPINADGAFFATSIGYGVVPNDDVLFSPPLYPKDPDERNSPMLADLTKSVLHDLSPDALVQGLRIRREMVRLVFDDKGILRTDLPSELLNRVFEPIHGPQDVSFRYAITDTGTGRDLQNQPLNNVAGLGIATGERPFKRLAREMLFRPNSTIRVSIREHYGRGRLYIAFHGYKVFGAHAFAGDR